MAESEIFEFLYFALEDIENKHLTTKKRIFANMTIQIFHKFYFFFKYFDLYPFITRDYFDMGFLLENAVAIFPFIRHSAVNVLQ